MATLTGSGPPKLPSIPMVERVSPSVVRILGGNGGKFTLQGTNTYLLGTSPHSLILIDTAQGFPQWREHVSSYLKDHNLSIKTCILTHWHGDHVLGVPDLLSISPVTKLYKNQTNKLDPEGTLTSFTIDDIADGQKFTDGSGFEIEAIHSPGHTKDHMSFIITKSQHAEEIGRIFTGDNVLGHGTAVFEDLGVYLKSLNVMKSRIQKEIQIKSQNATTLSSEDKVVVVKAYPSHGVIIDNAVAKIDEYIKHRKTREDEALNVLRYGSTRVSDEKHKDGREGDDSKKWKSMDIVKVIYKDVPENLHLPAQRGLLMVLEKLRGEGRVVKHGGDGDGDGEEAEDGLWSVSDGDEVSRSGKSTL